MNTTINNLKRQVASTTILYVDDEEMAQKYFARLLDKDYEVLTASDVDTALDMLRDTTKQIDIVVTDYRMPGRDGGDLLRQIELEFPHVVRILLTAYANREVLLNVANSGEVFRILEKPLDAGEISHNLQQACELLKQRKVKQQRLKAVDETLDFLVHELNTPLATITNFSKAIQRRVADANLPIGQHKEKQHTEIGKAAHAIDENARYSFALLSSFAESVKGAGGLTAHSASDSAQQMILSLLASYPLTSIQRDMIRIDTQEDFRITSLPGCVLLVLSSLLGNALRALLDQPAPMISITVLVEGNPQIRITDNGHGIPHEIMARLLVEPVTNYESFGGNGWGLIFCERVMRLFGGSVQIHSILNEHTTVTLNFPIIKDLKGAVNDRP